MTEPKPLTDAEINGRRKWISDWPTSEARALHEACYSEGEADRDMAVEARYLATIAERDEQIVEGNAVVEAVLADASIYTNPEVLRLADAYRAKYPREGGK